MNLTGRRDSFVKISPLCVFLLVLMMSTSKSKATTSANMLVTEELLMSTSIVNSTTNVLLTGEILSQGAKLSYPKSKARLELRSDCNLVLYDEKESIVWQSNTSRWFLSSCKLFFTENGRLVLNGTSLTGPISWITPNVYSKPGKYIAIVLPEGKLSIYGPMIWSEGNLKENIGNSSSNNNNGMDSSMIESRNSHMVYNVLFSGDILIDKGRRYDQGKLTDGGYSFTMTKECELVLQYGEGKISWRSRTRGNGKYCYARLSNYGKLAIRDFSNNLVWINDLPKKQPRGNYVLVMQRNGIVAIYGPEVWSIPSLSTGFIKMHTDDDVDDEKPSGFIKMHTDDDVDDEK